MGDVNRTVLQMINEMVQKDSFVFPILSCRSTDRRMSLKFTMPISTCAGATSICNPIVCASLFPNTATATPTPPGNQYGSRIRQVGPVGKP